MANVELGDGGVGRQPRPVEVLLSHTLGKCLNLEESQKPKEAVCWGWRGIVFVKITLTDRALTPLQTMYAGWLSREKPVTAETFTFLF